MTDSGIFRGSSRRDFGSCGRQNFACVKPNLDSIFVYLSRLEFDGKGMGYSLKYFSFESSRNTAAREELCLKNYFFSRKSQCLIAERVGSAQQYQERFIF